MDTIEYPEGTIVNPLCGIAFNAANEAIMTLQGELGETVEIVFTSLASLESVRLGAETSSDILSRIIENGFDATIKQFGMSLTTDPEPDIVIPDEWIVD